MTPVPDLGAARRLRAALQKELSFVPEVRAFLDEAVRALDEAPARRRPIQAAAVGAAVADSYSLAENALKRLCARFEGLPTGADWHRELLEAAALEIPETRPAIISEATRQRLEPLRRFRHVVRNVYGMRLDPDRALELAGGVGPALQAFCEDLARFDALLAALGGAATPTERDSAGT